MARKATSKAVAKAYEPTPHEQRAIEAVKEDRVSRPPPPKITIESNPEGAAVMGYDHPNMPTAAAVAQKAMGCHDAGFYSLLVKQLANYVSRAGKIDAVDLNDMMTLARSFEPQDQTEALLAVQMATVHSSIMMMSKRLACAETIVQQDSAERSVNKLVRTFTMQMETLRKYRSKGEQRVTVEHVTVNEGGQAIVGAVNQGGGYVRRNGQ